MNLTDKETIILTMLSVDPRLSNKDIGNILKVKQGTIKFHVSKMNKKHGTKNRFELLKMFRGV